MVLVERSQDLPIACYYARRKLAQGDNFIWVHYNVECIEVSYIHKSQKSDMAPNIFHPNGFHAYTTYYCTKRVRNCGGPTFIQAIMLLAEDGIQGFIAH